MFTFLPECYHERYWHSRKVPYSPAANDVWSLGVLFLDLACGDRIWETPVVGDEGYRRFSEDPPAFLRSEYPLNHRTRFLLLRIFSPELYRISLKALREEIRSLDDFYLSDDEIAYSTTQVQTNAVRYGPWTNPPGEEHTGLAKECEIEEDLPTSTDTDPSTEFVSIGLTTPPNEPSDFRLDCIKDECEFTPHITDIYPSTY